MDTATFARWTWERDLKVGVLSRAPDAKTRLEYLEEAKFYMSKDRGEWPCGILIKMAQHGHYHPNCDTTDPLA